MSASDHQPNLAQELARARQAFALAMRARSRGEYSRARRFLLTAAEALLLAAQVSPPLLREHRKRLAQNLIDEAEQIPQTPQGGRKRSSGTSGARSSPVDVNDDRGEDTGWLITERPQVRFDDVAGLEQVKEQIRLRLVYPFQRRDLAERYRQNVGGGLLLYGPPGTGKTLLARAVAGEIQAAFFTIKPSQIMSQWVGKAEQNLARLFAQARQFPVSVIFIDEFEALAPRRRTSHSTVMQRVVPQLLAEMDGFHHRENALLFIGATNEPWAIDAAVLRPGRLDRLIYVPPPDFMARRKILELNLQGVPLAPDVNLSAIAERTRDFSGADMAALAARARERVFLEAVKTGRERPVAQTDFEAVLAEMTPSILPEDLKRYREFAARRK